MRFITYQKANVVSWGAVVEADNGQLLVADLGDKAESLKVAIEQDLLSGLSIDESTFNERLPCS